MASIYLSPSSQGQNRYVNGGTEEYYMNLIADSLMSYLFASGIEVVRNNRNNSLDQSIAESNAGNFDLHLAFRSNTAPDYLMGTLQGPEVYHYYYNPQSQRAAEIFASNLALIYPDPSLVKATPTTSLDEIIETTSPAILVELGYHDNYFDAQWIKDNYELIASNLGASVAEALGVPFVDPFSG